MLEEQWSEDEQPEADAWSSEDKQQASDAGLSEDERPSEDEQLASDEAQSGDEVSSEDEGRADGERRLEDKQWAEDEGMSEDEQSAKDEAQDEQWAEDEGLSTNEQSAQDEAQAKDEQSATDEQSAKDEEWGKDEEWLGDKDAGVGSGDGGVVERTAGLVEEFGGEVVYVDHPGRGDRTVLGLPVEFVDGETPLIVSLHGYAGDSVYHSAFVPLHERVNADGFALLLPNALPDGAGNPAWNPTDECCDGGKSGEDDVAYLTELVAEATSSRSFGSVYFFGYSNGGFMSYHMACKALTGLRAVASLAGTSYVEDSSCDDAPPVSVLHIHGTADNVILYDGDETEPDPADEDGERVFYAGAEEMVERWSRRAGCDWPEHAQPYASLDLDQYVPGPETQAFRPESGCAEGISIELWSGVDSGHGPSYGDAFMDVLLDWLLSQT